MQYDLNVARKILRNHLSDKWDSIDFSYDLNDENLHVSAEVTLKAFDDDISIFIDVFNGGMAYFRAVFDKVNPQKISNILDYFRTLNQFNNEDLYFRAYVREDQYLVIDHSTSYNDESDLPAFVDECLIRLSKTGESKPLRILTAATE